MIRKIIGFIPFGCYCFLTAFMLLTDCIGIVTFSPRIIVFFAYAAASLASAVLLCTKYIKTGLIVGAAVPISLIIADVPNKINQTSEANGDFYVVFFSYLMFYVCYAVIYYIYRNEINKP